MPPVDEGELQEIWRAYVQERVNQQGGRRPFERATGIDHANLSRLLGSEDKKRKGKGSVTEQMVARIAKTIGPSVAEIYAIIGLRCANAAPKGSIIGYVMLDKKTMIKEEYAAPGSAAIDEARRDLGKRDAAHAKPGEQRRRDPAK